MTAYEYLKTNLEKEFKRYYGVEDEDFINGVAEAWMDDRHNSEHRFEIIRRYLPHAIKILDMASGCGTFVFYGLLHGHDAFGIEPEKWKNEFNAKKVDEYRYPEEWKRRFIESRGERLPFEDACFDFVSTYQTLEHVDEPEGCLAEMLRVTMVGGGVHICCPDYRSTFEGHYLLPWLPLMPRQVAKAYLRLIGRPVEGLAGLNYITGRKIRRCIARLAKEKGYILRVMDLKRASFNELLMAKWPGMESLAGIVYPIYRIYTYLKTLFRAELNTDLLIIIEGKQAADMKR